MADEKIMAELNDEDLDYVAGGKYSYDEWKAMSTEERRQAQLDSLNNRKQGLPCALE